jgi:aldose 1-epimerase
MKKTTARKFLFGAAALALLAGCRPGGLPASSSSTASSVTHAPFGTTPDGKPVEIYTLRNSKGAEARIMTYGGTVVSLKMPDKHGQFADVVLGYDTLEGYLKGSSYFGALIGRFGNRIAKARFTLDGQTHQLEANNGPNTLHGGSMGFDKVVWTADSFHGENGFPAMLALRYTSPDGEEGFPGTLKVTAIYSLTESNELRIDFTATTDKDTVVNLTHHSYWNLAGQENILNHQVQIFADKFTPVDATLIPTGALQPVEGTPFDFRKPTAIGLRIDETNGSEQLRLGSGYDHNYVFDKPPGTLGLLARVTDPASGRVMEVLSTEPGAQFYTANFLDGAGKGGRVYGKHAAFCFEPQHFPDSPNQPRFPTTELKPGEVFKSTIIHRFSAQ